MLGSNCSGCRRKANVADPAVRLAIASYESVAVKQRQIKAAQMKTSPHDTYSQFIQKAPTDKTSPGDTAAPVVQAEVQLRMARLPTFLSPYLSEDEYPLLSVRLSNQHYDRATKLQVTAEVKGYSQIQVKTVENVDPLSEASLNLFPPLLPGVFLRPDKTARAQALVRVEEIGTGQIVREHSLAVTLMEPNLLPLAVRDPLTAGWQDFSRYLGLFITPDDLAVRALLDSAAGILPERRFSGYTGDPKKVERQFQAIYNAFRQFSEIKVEPASGGHLRTHESVALRVPRLPVRVLSEKQANTHEIAVLIASLLEAAALNSAIVLVQGLAYIAWQEIPDVDQWRYLDLQAAGFGSFLGSFGMVATGAEGMIKAYARLRDKPGEYPSFLRLPVQAMRAAGVRPLERDPDFR